jgi:formate-dependent nitrite reductase membrane component NrfD
MNTLTDGRNIDSSLGALAGEGSHQHVIDLPVNGRKPWPEISSYIGDPTYYDQPVIKKSVWSWDIPAYYYVGGASGSAAALGAAAMLLNRGQLAGLIRQSRIIAIAGSMISSAFLVHDLGKPSRFLYMLRVFRPTSPMSVGSWILTFFSGSAGLSLIADFGGVPTVVAGLFGLGLAGYTGVLVSNTVVPVWQRPHRLMPVLFLSSGISAAASLFEICGGNCAERKAVTAFGAAGRLAELTLAELTERSIATVPEAARPLNEGFSGSLWKAAKVLTAASLMVSLIPGTNPRLRRVAGVLGTLGSICLRFGIHYAGQQSAMNPRATFHQQRARQLPAQL